MVLLAVFSILHALAYRERLVGQRTRTGELSRTIHQKRAANSDDNQAFQFQPSRLFCFLLCHVPMQLGSHRARKTCGKRSVHSFAPKHSS